MVKLIERKCAACNKITDRSNLIKITKEHKTGELIVNPDSKTFGRSVYLCYNLDCIENAFRKGKIYKILKTKPSETLMEKIKTVLAQ